MLPTHQRLRTFGLFCWLGSWTKPWECVGVGAIWLDAAGVWNCPDAAAGLSGAADMLAGATAPPPAPRAAWGEGAVRPLLSAGAAAAGGGAAVGPLWGAGADSACRPAPQHPGLSGRRRLRASSNIEFSLWNLELQVAY